MVARIALCFKLSAADSFKNRTCHNLWISCLWRCWSMEFFFSNRKLWDFIYTGHWKVYYPPNYREGKFLLAVHLQIYSTPKAAPGRPGFLLFSEQSIFLFQWSIKPRNPTFLSLNIELRRLNFKCQLTSQGPTECQAKSWHKNLAQNTFSANL